MKYFKYFLILLLATPAFSQVSLSYNESKSFFTGKFESGFNLPYDVVAYGFAEFDTYDDLNVGLSYIKYQFSKQLYDKIAVQAEFDDMPDRDYIFRVLHAYRIDLPYFNESYLTFKISLWSPVDGAGQKYSISPHINLSDRLIFTGYFDFYNENFRQVFISNSSDKAYVFRPQIEYQMGSIKLIGQYQHNRFYGRGNSSSFSFGVKLKGE